MVGQKAKPELSSERQTSSSLKETNEKECTFSVYRTKLFVSRDLRSWSFEVLDPPGYLSKPGSGVVAFVNVNNNGKTEAFFEIENSSWIVRVEDCRSARLNLVNRFINGSYRKWLDEKKKINSLKITYIIVRCMQEVGEK